MKGYPAIKEEGKIFRLMTRVVTPEPPYTENSYTPLCPVELMDLLTRILIWNGVNKRQAHGSFSQIS